MNVQQIGVTLVNKVLIKFNFSYIQYVQKQWKNMFSYFTHWHFGARDFDQKH